MGHDIIATFFGDVVVTHDARTCAPPCTIHSPSDHHMVKWPQNWRGDRKIMERVCEHLVFHPDPDDLRIRSGRLSSRHFCDGCCTPPASAGGVLS